MPKARKSKKRTSKKRARKNVKTKWWNKTDEEWERWGEALGKKIEKSFKNKKCHIFGPFCPLFGSIFEIVVLAIFIAIIGWVNTMINFAFLQSIVFFISINLHWLFIFTLFKNYLNYLSDVFDMEVLKPINVAIGISVALWVISGILQTQFISNQSHMLYVFSQIILSNIWGIFSFLLVAGYIIFAMMWSVRDHIKHYKRTS